MSVFSGSILLLSPMRVWRTYRGGARIEALHAGEPLMDADSSLVNITISERYTDGDYPEEWIASTIEARNPTDDVHRNGLARVGNVTLHNILEETPEKFLGTQHVALYGKSPAVLTKLIDTVERLSIQVHPTRQVSSRVFGSPFGKTEGWYVLPGRIIDGDKPHIYLGFKPGVTRQHWEDLFERQDIAAMLDMLHRIEVEPGDIFLVGGGTPHAIGPGCFLVEVQEPTDYTMRVERTDARGTTLPEQICHQGIGFDAMFDCFSYEGSTLEEAVAQWKFSPLPVDRVSESVLDDLIGSRYSKYFGLHRLYIRRTVQLECTKTFAVALVLSGTGSISTGGGEELRYKPGDSFFISYSAGYCIWRSSGIFGTEVVITTPPKNIIDGAQSLHLVDIS
jgi:mannose-6-phosphate isomerase